MATTSQSIVKASVDGHGIRQEPPESKATDRHLI